MAKVLTFVSAVGGIGKSTLCASVAYALAKREQRVLLVDLSFDAPALDILFGVSESVVYTVCDVMGGAANAEKALFSLPENRKEPYLQNILLAPSSLIKPEGAEGVESAVRNLADAACADYVLIDASPSVYPSLFAISDERILITDTRQSALRAAEAFVQTWAERAPLNSFLLCGASLVRESVLKEEPLLDIIDRLSLSLLGVLPYSGLLRDEGVLFEKRYEKEAYVRAVKNVAARIAGENVPLLNGIALEGISRRFYIERSNEK